MNGPPLRQRTITRFASPLATRISDEFQDAFAKRDRRAALRFLASNLQRRTASLHPVIGMENILILIPARMGSSRLPGKPLADIAGEPMIVHVLRRAQAARLGPVVVATDSEAIAACVEKAGGRAAMTRSDHASGSDRIFEALPAADLSERAGIIVNVQGDLPMLAPTDIAAAVEPLADPAVDIGTLAAETEQEQERLDPNVVKVIGTPIGRRRLRALYFTRAPAPAGEGPLYHHIGLYAYRRAALARFVALPPSPLEVRERLEQLRALEAGMRIDVTIVDSVPLGVDTPADLERARLLLGNPLT
jgi:3-deoxy-manno-octulosonate cytidylyltransferase (CMP-KDO synthetase)